MKIQFIRSDMQVNQNLIAEFDPETMVENEESGRWYWRTDVVFDQETAREAQLHVGMGNAEPVDEEAKRACANFMTDWPKRLAAREALAKGIAPEDLERFHSGELLGYKDGRDVLAGDEEDIEDDSD